MSVGVRTCVNSSEEARSRRCLNRGETSEEERQTEMETEGRERVRERE